MASGTSSAYVPEVQTSLVSESSMEEEVLVSAAHQVLLFVGKPMHFKNIDNVMKSKNLVGPGMKTTLESALSKECQKGTKRRVNQVEGQPGVYMVARKAVKVKALSTKRKSQSVMKKTGQVVSNAELQQKYKMKYKLLRKTIKDWVFMNAAVCDEVATVEDKVLKVKEERKYLLTKLLPYQSPADLASYTLGQNLAAAQAAAATAQATAAMTSGASPSAGASYVIPSQMLEDEPSSKKTGKKKLTLKERKSIMEAIAGKKGKAEKHKVIKRFISPILLDNTARPVFPIELGDLVIYSIGDISDRLAFHCAKTIYPVGFCSTRLYASLRHINQHCLYTCNIQDIGHTPKFEISADDDASLTFSNHNIDVCHKQLMDAINRSRGVKLVDSSSPDGAEFFGLTHPSVQNLIQSLPGAKDAANYHWTKYVIAKTETAVYKPPETNPGIYYQAFVKQPANQQVLERYKSIQAAAALKQAPPGKLLQQRLL